MFNAFFDESQADSVFLVAGWVATAEEWTKFDAAWNAALASEPAIRCFHHYEAKMVEGEFGGWSNEEAQAKLAALVRVICDHDMYGVTTGLNTKSWKDAFSSETLSPKRLKGILKITHHYQSCFHSAVAAVLQRQLELGHSSEVVNFIFDQQDGLLKDNIKLYSQFKNLFPEASKKIAGEIFIGDDKDTPALQAADLLAGQLTTMLKSGAGPMYQELVKCHQVIQTTAYPPNFETLPAIVEAVSWAWNEKRKIDAEIAGHGEKREVIIAPAKKTDDE